MVFRLVGIIGLTLLPWLAHAGEVSVHQALGKWLRDNGVGSASYQPKEGARGRPADWPEWLLRPKGADALNRHFLGRGIFPEATGLGWEEDSGAVRLFGARKEASGMRLAVDRDGQRPVLLRDADGVVWRFREVRQQNGRASGLPQEIVRTGPEGERTVYVLR
ncbi:hypothetical protein AN478_02230 [Thiohalorhabdus denitrificans]|uniref:Uncharacterized protein n=1 Tax=Thiohalorhabdus denitrificans TaxID=381306 RepID=A0A0P9C848_9GAMM|nr:hypothetical protein [Thiohalorhabdus denitrificans]KPV41415.1 hypothetical protein AN478_02230 [Thiohalorhabdus denitrificans]SCY26555.1 hypothetical protein SAMN05661077_1637 [Thiohalorhabdus denitrificans]